MKKHMKKYIIILGLLAVALLSLLTVTSTQPARAQNIAIADQGQQTSETCDTTDQPCDNSIPPSTDQQLASASTENTNDLGNQQDIASRGPTKYYHTHTCSETGSSQDEAYVNCKASLDHQIDHFKQLRARGAWYELDHCSPYSITVITITYRQIFSHASAGGQTTCLYWFHNPNAAG